MSDTIHALRRLDFCSAARATLQHLENSYGGNQGGIPGIGEELNDQLVDEFLFGQRGRGGYNKKLNSLQELQLLELLIHYFKSQPNEWATNAIFRALFGCNPLPPYRLPLLQKFISMAVGVGCTNALNSSAVWMQIHGCGSETVTRITQSLVNDYCLLSSDGQNALSNLPEVSSHFASSFITSVTHIYFPAAHSNQPELPEPLLCMLTDWLIARPQLCLFSLYNTQNAFLQPHRTNLWTSPTKTNTQTPVPGLVRWCTSAPLLLLYTKQGTGNNNSSGNNDKDNISTSQAFMLWSKLHLALLECIVGFSNVPGAARLELLTLGDMNRIVRSVDELIKITTPDTPKHLIEVTLDRLVQILQVSLATGGFRCSLADLKKIFTTIPETRLLQVLAKQHLSTAPPQMHNERL